MQTKTQRHAMKHKMTNAHAPQTTHNVQYKYDDIHNNTNIHNDTNEDTQ